MARLISQFALLAMAAVVLAGCDTTHYDYPDAGPVGTNATVGVNTPVSTASTNEQGKSDLLWPGMKIAVIFSGLNPPPPQHREQIREDGFINPPLLKEKVKAAGKTIGQLQQELQDLYVPNYYRNATITVSREEIYFWVTGEVKSSGQKPYLSKMTISGAIAAAGGFTEFAKKTKVQVLRASGHIDTINCDKAFKNPKYDVPIYPGDTIVVNQRGI